MACHGILDKLLCERSCDAFGSCRWSGSQSSGSCEGEQKNALPEPTFSSDAELSSSASEPYDLRSMLSMYLWTALTALAVIVVFVLIVRVERSRPSGHRPDRARIKAAMRPS
jgi:hypothetical protein